METIDILFVRKYLRRKNGNCRALSSSGKYNENGGVRTRGGNRKDGKYGGKEKNKRKRMARVKEEEEKI